MGVSSVYADNILNGHRKENGVKLVDPRGEMLESTWESHATVLANAPTTEAFIAALDTLVKTLNIDLTKPAKVVYARDTRPSGGALVSALEDGIKAIDAEGRNAGVTTTPVLHYLVRAINTKGTKDEYGEDSEEGYMKKLSTAFKKLVVSTSNSSHQGFLTSLTVFHKVGKPSLPPLVIDCANGVGAQAANKLGESLGDTLRLLPVNTSVSIPGALNNSCGADFVKTTQKLPPSLTSHLKPGQRACSLDGDADRLIYFYVDDRSQFHMLDGDKIAALVAAFIVELTKAAGLEEHIKVGIVQTAYANGSSTKYLSEVSPNSSTADYVAHNI